MMQNCFKNLPAEDVLILPLVEQYKYLPDYAYIDIREIMKMDVEDYSDLISQYITFYMPLRDKKYTPWKWQTLEWVPYGVGFLQKFNNSIKTVKNHF